MEEAVLANGLISTLNYGKRFVVVKGRNVPHGTVGILKWFGWVTFGGRSYFGRLIGGTEALKVGLKDDDGKMWYTYAYNILEATDEVMDGLCAVGGAK